MAYEMKDNSGSIFRNDKREKDTHPHATGKCLIDGKLYYISAWTKEGNSGKFQSLSFKAAEQKPAAPRQAAPKQAQPQMVDDDLSDVPF
jgi:hypothetical protein